ncbi:hypothetical protein F6R98_08400 [Candidatus Methylospira mobilis]|uniref:Uncharacterized protein n=2 Tax=Candidatus Methylospira mobilis TaxID=1808979 RepID=A0A5Q0BFP2_9GAMM|nr:hypothetical protein [Candidatus Methylospira mobilis]QFY42640.1 hypothetical protein F6R98_08400 [Candidatus Methylospira mobilis]
MDSATNIKSSVRKVLAEVLRASKASPASIHRSLMQFADRGAAKTIVRTNFDLLLEGAAAKRSSQAIQSYALGEIPRRGRHEAFSGVLHIHGALNAIRPEPRI